MVKLKTLMPSLFADRVFRLTYNSILNRFASLRRVTAATQYTSNMAAATVADRSSSHLRRQWTSNKQISFIRE